MVEDFLDSEHGRLRTLLAKPTARYWLARGGENTPVLFLEPERVAEMYRRFQAALPMVHSHYALKANAHRDVATTIRDLNGYFDAATNREIDLLAELQVDPGRVIHTHPYKKPRDIRHAYEYGIRTFVVDSLAEIEKFLGYTDVRLLIRLGYSNPYAHVDLSSKFGVPHAEAEMLLAAAAGMGLHVAGFSYHPGSHLQDIETFLSTARQTVSFMQRLMAAGHVFDVLDIGGGFPAAYTGQVLSIEEIAAALIPVLQPVVEAGVTVLAEPGRAIVAEAMTLVASVVGVAEGSTGKWYMLDDGLYGSYSNILTEHIHPLIIAEKQLLQPEVELVPATLGGPTCDSVDVIAVDLPLPELQIGDLILSPTMGAYTSVTASEFNGIPLTKIVTIR